MSEEHKELEIAKGLAAMAEARERRRWQTFQGRQMRSGARAVREWNRLAAKERKEHREGI